MFLWKCHQPFYFLRATLTFPLLCAAFSSLSADFSQTLPVDEAWVFNLRGANTIKKSA